MINKVKFSLLESSNANPVTKKISLNSEGVLEKESLAHNLSRGNVQTLETTFAEYGACLTSLKPSQAIAYGVNKDSNFARIITKRDQSSGFSLPDDITRSNDTFVYQKSPGIFFGDNDDKTTSGKALWDILTKIYSPIDAAPAIYRPSTSSCIFNMDTDEELVGVKGFRLNFGVDNASLIPAFGKVLHDHFWLTGHGHYVISKSGSFLDRGPLDTSVWQPSRIDFCSGAYCIPPLEQRLPPPYLINEGNPFLDIAKAVKQLELTDAQRETLRILKAQARAAMETEAKEIREAWIEKRTQEFMERQGITRDVAEGVLREALETRSLSGSFEILLQNGETVTVAEILSSPEKYHGTHCADPLEPEYHGDRRVGYISVSGRFPYIWSHAHGGVRYRLNSARKNIIVEPGRTTFTVDATVEELRKNPNVFDKDGRLVLVHGDSHESIDIDVLDNYALRDFLGREFQYQKVKYNANSETLVDIDPPENVCQQLLARGRRRGLRELKGISTVPTMRPDGSIVDMNGYDDATQLLMSLPSNCVSGIPINPSIEVVVKALKYFWEPFKEFPFIDDISRAVFLSAGLTAAIRKVLPTAPAIALNATVAGAGKTLLANCLGFLAQGKPVPALPELKSEAETQKVITSMLLRGVSVIHVDNIVGSFSSPTLEAFLTAEKYTDRILGSNSIAELSTAALFLVTGNHIKVVGDLNRRVLMSTIDPGTEKPYLREFNVDPLIYVKEHRLNMIRASLIMIRGYLTSGMGQIQPGKMASFHMWDKFVRQAICWLATLPCCPIGLADPASSIKNNYEDDPVTERLKCVLNAWHDLYGNALKTSKSIVNELLNPSSIENKPKYERLYEVLLDAAGTNKPNIPLDSKCLSSWLDKNYNRPVDGYILKKGETKRNGYTQWAVHVHKESIVSGGSGGSGGSGEGRHQQASTSYAPQEQRNQSGEGTTSAPTNPTHPTTNFDIFKGPNRNDDAEQIPVGMYIPTPEDIEEVGKLIGPYINSDLSFLIPS